MLSYKYPPIILFSLKMNGQTDKIEFIIATVNKILEEQKAHAIKLDYCVKKIDELLQECEEDMGYDEEEPFSPPVNKKPRW